MEPCLMCCVRLLGLVSQHVIQSKPSSTSAWLLCHKIIWATYLTLKGLLVGHFLGFSSGFRESDSSSFREKTWHEARKLSQFPEQRVAVPSHLLTGLYSQGNANLRPGLTSPPSQPSH